jgi:anti-sigma factor RsiW
MTDWTPLASKGAEDASEHAARESRHQVLIELLGAYADRELPAETTSQIEAHLVGCARCRSELAVHQAVRLRLGVTPPVAAPPALRERIAAAIAAIPVTDAPPVVLTSPRATIWMRPRTIVAAVAALLTIITAVAIGVARREPGAAMPPNVTRLAVSAVSIPLLNDALLDYRRVTAGDLPGRARDLDLVRGAVAFPVEPLRASGVRLLAAWTTDLGGEPAAVLAYRWDDRIILQYLVPEDHFFRNPAIRAAFPGHELLLAGEGAQGIVAWPTQEGGAILIGDVAPERLARLTVADLLAKTARRGAE